MKPIANFLKVSLLSCLLLLCSSAWATHISGGYIAYKWLDRNDYEITVGVFYDGSDGIPVMPEIALAIYGIEARQLVLPLKTYINPKPGQKTGIALYQMIYTFPEVSFFGGVRYKIAVNLDNRSREILNMFRSFDSSFYVETEIYVNPFLGINSSAAPSDTIAAVSGKVNQTLIADLSSIDPDGDSLVYRLVIPMQSFRRDVINYRSPENVQPCAGCTFAINPQTGQITWNQPQLQGSYTIAVMVEEWRKIPGTSQSLRMGYTIKDILLVISN
jgi:hypothetical protein